MNDGHFFFLLILILVFGVYAVFVSIEDIIDKRDLAKKYELEYGNLDFTELNCNQLKNAYHDYYGYPEDRERIVEIMTLRRCRL